MQEAGDETITLALGETHLIERKFNPSIGEQFQIAKSGYGDDRITLEETSEVNESSTGYLYPSPILHLFFQRSQTIFACPYYRSR